MLKHSLLQSKNYLRGTALNPTISISRCTYKTCNPTRKFPIFTTASILPLLSPFSSFLCNNWPSCKFSKRNSRSPWKLGFRFSRFNQSVLGTNTLLMHRRRPMTRGFFFIAARHLFPWLAAFRTLWTPDFRAESVPGSAFVREYTGEANGFSGKESFGGL